MNDLPSPSVRTIIVCEKVIRDANNSNSITLVNLIASIRPRSDPRYPLLQPELWVFVELVECRGSRRMRVEVRDGETEKILYATNTQTVPLPNSPLVVARLSWRIRKFAFPVAGLYWVQVWYEDQLLSQRSIELVP
jgi:hypothetical protein